MRKTMSMFLLACVFSSSAFADENTTQTIGEIGAGLTTSGFASGNPVGTRIGVIGFAMEIISDLAMAIPGQDEAKRCQTAVVSDIYTQFASRIKLNINTPPDAIDDGAKAFCAEIDDIAKQKGKIHLSKKKLEMLQVTSFPKEASLSSYSDDVLYSIKNNPIPVCSKRLAFIANRERMKIRKNEKLDPADDNAFAFEPNPKKAVVYVYRDEM